ncbi:hypothetical protein C7974DRAFT_377894 [Boeremia exigua]|uniref:uncharacterized protein n=1 Tax=Boeremia exigua TaxID=749465 RepID=UPI001E8E2C31|nr:uncharacterized protein C7974DRAFT_377894 [Boeremia exigua]KAH6622310.1 hypothetical protein C7974DRAFT_377894 [Boeremia exigua]
MYRTLQGRWKLRRRGVAVASSCSFSDATSRSQLQLGQIVLLEVWWTGVAGQVAWARLTPARSGTWSGMGAGLCNVGDLARLHISPKVESSVKCAVLILHPSEVVQQPLSLDGSKAVWLPFDPRTGQSLVRPYKA